MESLGLDIRLLVAQIINFTVLLIILNKVLYKPLMKMLDERSRKIDESVKNSEEIAARLVKIEEKEKNVLEKARDKARVERKELLMLANVEKDKIISEARDASEKEIRKGIQRIEAYEAEVASELKTKFMDDVLDMLSDKLAKESMKKKFPVLKKVIKNQ